MEKIYYLGYYDIPENAQKKRNCVLAATNKMNYIISALEKNGYAVQVISAATAKCNKTIPAERVKIGKQSELVLFKSFPWGNKLQKILSRFYIRSKLYFALSKLKATDTLIAYHAMGYISTLKRLKKRKKFKLILELEEIYSYVTGRKEWLSKEQSLLPYADGFLFPTELLDEQMNTQRKPSVIIHGTYQTEPQRMDKHLYRAQEGWDAHKIHVVYAGNLEARKGVISSIRSAEFLDERYHLHILGFGSAPELERVSEEIKNVTQKTNCKVTFDGLLRGEEYIRFIQGCDIGLSTQNPDAEYNETSFPSKTLSYIANGLKVVCIRISAIERSAVGKDVYFYNGQTPQEIAKTIKSVNLDDGKDGREIVQALDQKFTAEIKELLEK